MSRPQVKVCGLNDAVCAIAAERAGADYLGFIFAAKSPRHVTPEEVCVLVPQLSGRAKRVGVFTSGSAAEIAAIARRCSLQIVQLHWRVPADLVAALRAEGLEVWTLAGGASGDAVLFDSSHGDGERTLKKGAYRTILAGGVSAANLAGFLAQAPDIIDVSGSLETAPGVKSVEKIDAFFTTWTTLTARLPGIPSRRQKASCT